MQSINQKKLDRGGVSMGDETLMINGGRLWDSLMEMAKIGPTKKGGSCRLALTDLDREARDLFVQWCRDAGCSTLASWASKSIKPSAAYDCNDT